MKKRVRFISTSIVLAFAVLLAACQPASKAPASTTAAPDASNAATTAPGAGSDSKEILQIGLVTPLTGSFAFGSNEVKNAIELAVEKRPEILGKKVVFEVGDASDASQAMSEFERLYAKGVRYFMGGFGTFMDLSIQKVVDDRNCIFISAAGWADQLTETKIKNYFHFTPRVAVFGERVAQYSVEYAEKYLNKKPADLRYAVVWNSNVEYVANAALNALEKAGLTVALKEGYPPDRKDFTALVSKLQSENVDVLIPCQQSVDGIPFRKKMVEMGYEPPMLFAMGMIYDQPDYAALGEEITDGPLVLSYTHPHINRSVAPGLDEFAEKYNKIHGWYPLTHATQTYSATLLLLDTIEKAGSTDVDKVQPVLESVDVPAGQYPNYWGVKFDENHRNIRAGDPLVIGQWQRGTLVAVGTDAIKTHDAIVPWDKTKLK